MVEQINVKKNSSDPEYETRLGRLTASLDLNVAFYFTNLQTLKLLVLNFSPIIEP